MFKKKSITSPKLLEVLRGLIFLSLFCATGALCDRKPPFRDPPLPTMERSTYEIKEKGKRFLSPRAISRKNRDGKEVYVLLADQLEIDIKVDDLRTLSVRKINDMGKIEYTCEYQHDKRRVHFIYPGPERNRVKEIPGDSYDINTMMEIIRGYPFDKQKPEVEFTLVTPDQIMGVYARIQNEEKFTTSLGTFDCYFIEVGVSGLKGKIIRTKHLFWIEKEYPYRVIRHKDSNDERILTLVGYEILPDVKTTGS